VTQLLLISALIGTTLIVSSGTIFSFLRKLWPSFLGCSQCVGLWVGAAFGVSGLVTTGYGLVADVIVVGSATSFLSLLANKILLKLDD
jgi:hypothetical protein